MFPLHHLMLKRVICEHTEFSNLGAIGDSWQSHEYSRNLASTKMN